MNKNKMLSEVTAQIFRERKKQRMFLCSYYTLHGIENNGIKLHTEKRQKEQH